MNEINSLATSLGTYGVYTLVSILCVCVVYLFREVNLLNKKIQDILSDKNNDYKELLLKTTIAIENSSKVLERVEKALDKD